MAVYARLSLSTSLSMNGAVGSILQPSRGQGWSFALPSALIGFILGCLAALGIYLLRHRIAAARDAVRDRVLHIRQRVSTGVEERYREQVIEAAERSHLLWRYAPLSDVYISRRFGVPQALPRDLRPPESEGESQRWHQMRLHDMLHPSPVTTEIAEAIKHHNKLAILGPSGSGRTTVLNHLMALFARQDAWRMSTLR